MKTLFLILYGFVAFNLALNLMLLFISRQKIYRQLTFYWFCLLAVFIAQGLAQNGVLPIVLAYGLSSLSMTSLSYILFSSFSLPFPTRAYVLFFLALYPITYALYLMGLSFTVVAMPFSIGIGIPLLHGAWVVFVKEKKRASTLQKFMGVLFILMPIHCLNFAFFRMEPGAQIWGWTLAYAIYQALAVLLPAFSLEALARNEKNILERQVRKRTEELSHSYDLISKNSLQLSNLLKVISHDILNPLNTQFYCLSEAEQYATSSQRPYLEQMKKSAHAIREIIDEVREMETLKLGKQTLAITPIDVDKCMEEVADLFSAQLKAKSIKLKFNNSLAPGAKVLAHRKSFVYSVLGNLISNALKFSPLNGEITVELKRGDEGKILLIVSDCGQGINAELLPHIFDPFSKLRSDGDGPHGSGFGLPIVKSYIDLYQGKIHVTGPAEGGAQIILTLNEA